MINTIIMAVSYKKLYTEYIALKGILENAPLDKKELKILSKLEEYIDTEIVLRFKGDSVLFDYSNIDIYFTEDISTPRRELIKKELQHRYNQAGWDIIKQIDNEPNELGERGSDHWVFMGKD